MIWNYTLRGVFLNPEPKAEKEQSSKKNKDDKILVHKIVEGYLPQSARENIREFLTLNKISECKIGLVSHGEGTDYEILWYIPKGKNWSEKDQKSLLEALSWFLPLNYNVAWAKTDDKALHLEPI